MTDHDYYITENLLALRNTRIGNLMEQCVLTLPAGQPSCGLSIMCAPAPRNACCKSAWPLNAPSAKPFHFGLNIPLLSAATPKTHAKKPQLRRANQ